MIAVGLATTLALAITATGADAHVLAGAQAFRDGRFGIALGEFRAAERLGAPGAGAYAAAALVKLRRPEEALEAFASAPPGEDGLLAWYRALACYDARLYVCAERQLPDPRRVPEAGAAVKELRAEIARVLAPEPATDSIDWYLARCELRHEEGRSVLATAYCREAAALGARRPDRHGVARAEAILASRGRPAASRGSGSKRFLAGLEKMDAGDLRGAIADFRAARGEAVGASAALLEGICRYELGEDRQAEPPLRIAERSGENADLAKLYLGLLALREGSESRAASLLDAAGASDAIGPIASDLAWFARSEARWSLTIAASSGWDSNVNLAPPSAQPAREADGLYTFGASGVFRPRGSDGPYLRGGGFANRQFRLDGFDVVGGDLAGGWRLQRERWSGIAEYDFSYRTLGGSPFLTSNQGFASAWTSLGAFTIGATYLARFESYADGFSPYSGNVQAGEVRTTFGLGARARLALAYGLARGSARLSILSYVEHGPRAELRWTASRGVRLGLAFATKFRRYDVFDPALGVRRDDVVLDAGGLAEWDLSSGWTARVALRSRLAFSNAAGYDSTKWVPVAGLSYTFAP